MNRDEPVPAREDIVKYASAQFIFDDGTVNLQVLWPRDGRDANGSSVNRLAVFGDDPVVALRRIAALSRLTVKPSGRFLQVNIGHFQDLMRRLAAEVRVVADPLPAAGDAPADPSHALLQGMPGGRLAAAKAARDLARMVTFAQPVEARIAVLPAPAA